MLGKIENMKLSNILYAFSTYSAFTLTSGNSPDKTNNEFFALIINYNYLLAEVNFLSQLEDNQFKGLSHLDSITSTYRVFFFNWASPEFAKCWPVINRF